MGLVAGWQHACAEFADALLTRVALARRHLGRVDGALQGNPAPIDDRDRIEDTAGCSALVFLLTRSVVVQSLRAGLVLLMAALLSGATACAAGLPGDDRSDEPAPRLRASFRPIHAATYDEALGLWRTPEDINAWIGASFEYDSARAMQLSETQRAAGTSPPIHAPGDFYAKPSGICVDLARFAVDTLRIIAPDVQPRYVMIEFDPLTLAGNVLRRHWVATFQRGGQHYFFADSKRPGHVYGPYESHEAFLGEYAQYRQRTIVAARVLESYQRRLKSKAVAQPFGAR